MIKKLLTLIIVAVTLIEGQPPPSPFLPNSDECLPPNVELRAKPYCVVAGCEADATILFCINQRLTAVLANENESCPAGSERGSKRSICFDEKRTAEDLCWSHDRSNTPAAVQPYCVADGLEVDGFVPLREGNVPWCGDRACVTQTKCPAGQSVGKRRFACNIEADIVACQAGSRRTQVPGYCYPDTATYDYSPYCGAGDCVFGDIKTGACPSGTRRGQIRTYCAEEACPAEAVITVRPYCEPLDAPSYVADANGVAYCGKPKAPCPTPDTTTRQCPPDSQLGAMQSVCDLRLVKESLPTVQSYCNKQFEWSYLVNDDGIALCGEDNQPCPQPNATTNECPPDTSPGFPHPINQHVLDDTPQFAIRLILRSQCTARPSTSTDFHPYESAIDGPLCSDPQQCIMLNSTLDICPAGMFRTISGIRLIPDPTATECPQGLLGQPPNCEAPAAGFAPAAVDLNTINPNALKSLIG